MQGSISEIILKRYDVAGSIAAEIRKCLIEEYAPWILKDKCVAEEDFVLSELSIQSINQEVSRCLSLMVSLTKCRAHLQCG